MCPLLVLSTLDCTQFWYSLPWSLSAWDFVYFESVHSGFCPRVVPSNWKSVHLGVCLFHSATRKSVHMTNFKLRIVSTASSFQPGLCSLFLFRLFESLCTWESGNMTFCHIVSTIGSVKYGLYSLLVLSTWESVHLGLCLL